jgi:hypothetical protein
MKTTDKITLRQTGPKTFTVFANGIPCIGLGSLPWSGDFATVAHLASSLACELGWPVFFEPGSEVAK